ncbi:MAG: hypothetical protein V1901_04390 [Patescibacteria group bacterium]
MPYVPSLKTDGKSQDRILIDVAVEKYSDYLVSRIYTNGDLYIQLSNSFIYVGEMLLLGKCEKISSEEAFFTRVILDVGDKYDYKGAFLGELNYGITRVIQIVPQKLAKQGKCGLVVGKELRYWLYAMIVDCLITTSIYLAKKDSYGVAGVFEDIKDEYKRRCNVAYEAEQIIKSGDCYENVPYHTVLTEIRSEDNNLIGHIEIMITRKDFLKLIDTEKISDVPITLTLPVKYNK